MLFKQHTYTILYFVEGHLRPQLIVHKYSTTKYATTHMYVQHIMFIPEG